MPQSWKILAVVVAFNDPSSVAEVVATASRTVPSGSELLVFDNSTSVEAADAIRRSLPQGTRYHRSASNVGYAGAAAAVLPLAFSADFDAVILLNQDLDLSESFFTDIIRAANDQPNPGVVGPTVMSKRNRGCLLYVGGRIVAPWYHVKLSRAREDSLDYVNGSAILITRNAFEVCGNFDSEYVMYFEEADYCVRAHKAGLSVSASSAVVYHEPGDRGVHYAYWMTRNRIRFFRKHGKARQLVPFLAYLLFYSSVVLAKKYYRQPISATRGIFAALRWNFTDIRRKGFWLR